MLKKEMWVTSVKSLEIYLIIIFLMVGLTSSIYANDYDEASKKVVVDEDYQTGRVQGVIENLSNSDEIKELTIKTGVLNIDDLSYIFTEIDNLEVLELVDECHIHSGLSNDIPDDYIPQNLSLYNGNSKIKSLTITNCIRLGRDSMDHLESLEILSMPKLKVIENGGSSGFSIFYGAFEGASNLYSVDMPSLETIGTYSFKNCPSLESLSLPALTTVEINGLTYTPNLSSIYLPEVITIKSYGIDFCNLLDIDVSNASYISNSFQSITGLKEITFDKLETIEGSFVLNTDIEDLYFNMLEPPQVIDLLTYGRGSSGSLHVPAGLESVYDIADNPIDPNNPGIIDDTEDGKWFGWPIIITINDLSGQVTIDNNKPEYGDQIRASVNSNGTGDFYYQWLRDQMPIEGEVEETYWVSLEDIGSELSVVVTNEVESGSIQSEATDLVTKAKPGQPLIAEVIFKDHESISIKEVEGYEYRINEEAYQSVGEFSGLSPETEYRIQQRIRETDSHHASEPSEDLRVTTDRLPINDLSGQVIIDNNKPEYGDQIRASVNSNGTGDFKYQWLRDQMPIEGEVEETYWVSLEDIGSELSVVVTNEVESGSIQSEGTDLVTKTKPGQPLIAEVIFKDHESIIIKEVEGYEYRINEELYQSEGKFTGLSPETEYSIQQRIRETDSHHASEPSEDLRVRTDAEVIVSKPISVRKRYTISFKLIDSLTGENISNKTCSINNKIYTSSKDGLVSINNIKKGTYEFEIIIDGYKAFLKELRVNGSKEISVELEYQEKIPQGILKNDWLLYEKDLHRSKIILTMDSLAFSKDINTKDIYLIGDGGKLKVESVEWINEKQVGLILGKRQTLSEHLYGISLGFNSSSFKSNSEIDLIMENQLHIIGENIDIDAKMRSYMPEEIIPEEKIPEHKSKVWVLPYSDLSRSYIILNSQGYKLKEGINIEDVKLISDSKLLQLEEVIYLGPEQLGIRLYCNQVPIEDIDNIGFELLDSAFIEKPREESFITDTLIIKADK